MPFLTVNVVLVVAAIQTSFRRDSLGGDSKIIIVSLLIVALLMNHTFPLFCQILVVVNEVMLREKEKKRA